MNYKNLHSVYFIGVGGIGMSSIARYFISKDVAVSAYDKTRTKLTDQLSYEGINIHYEDDYSLIPNIKKIDLVVYTPAIPKDNGELLYFQNTDIPIYKRSEILGLITKNNFNIAVAGTHGKTSTSTIIAHILESSGFGCNAFLGGISTNYSSNSIINNNSEVTVVEADEYDRSFLKLFPNIAVITSIDADHLDIYKDEKELKNTFKEFISLLPEDGKLISLYNLELNFKNNLTYGENNESDLIIKNINIIDGIYYFEIKYKEKEIKNLCLGLAGKHNVYNAAAAILIAIELGIKERDIRKSLLSFKGIKRRFEYQIQNDDLIYIDDYAHHPKEIDAFLNSVNDLYPNKKITGIFQPHLYSRTQDFMDDFAESLSKLDEVILLDIYPAREKPILGINSNVLLNKIKCSNKKLLSKKELISDLQDRYLEVLLTMGAGNIDELVVPIKLALELKHMKN